MRSFAFEESSYRFNRLLGPPLYIKYACYAETGHLFGWQKEAIAMICTIVLHLPDGISDDLRIGKDGFEEY